MKRVILLAIFLLTIPFSFAKSFTYEANFESDTKFVVTKADVLLIKKAPNKRAIIKRLKAYKKLLANAKNVSSEKKLEMVNRFFNKFKYKKDYENYQKIDHWASRKEFLIKGSGDCEDYAIAKYTTLLELGIKKENLSLFLTSFKGKKHMVVVYTPKQKSQKLILDSNNFRILAKVKRTDLKLFTRIS